jgi:isocitrate/isopropylmalate dehydrogenase
MVMWDEIATEIAAEFKDVTWDKMLVDAMTMRMVMRPETLDTIVATNVHADVLSDLAAALAGSLGIAPTANLNPERQFLRCSSRSTARPSTSRARNCQSHRHVLVRGDAARAFG